MIDIVEDTKAPQQAPFCLAPQADLAKFDKMARIFYIRGELWEALSGIGEQFDPAEAWNAIWPFDAFKVRYVGGVNEQIEDRDHPGDFTKLTRTETMFVRKVLPGANVVVAAAYHTANFYFPDGSEHEGAAWRQGIAFNGSGMTSVHTYQSQSDNNIYSLDDGTMGGLLHFGRMVAFCDMLTFSRHLVSVRKIKRDKKKVVKWGSLAQSQPQSAYEIVLRPNVTIYDAGEEVSRSIQSRRPRAHPRRHAVEGHIREVNGKIILVKGGPGGEGFMRGGKLDETGGPQPVYNAMPLARWYTQHGEK